MRPTVFQRAELRDENDNIIQQGTYGKGSALSNSTNDAWIDYVMNNLEALYGIAKDEVVPVSALPASGDMNKTYLLTTNGKTYRWSGTEWIELTSSEAVGRAETAANLAEQWATKTDGTVADNEYSAKYYANSAQQSADDAQDVADDMADHLAQIDQNTGGVSANSKRIGNIEKLLQGNLYDYDTDDDTAYVKTVPAGALPYAGLEKLGGKTVVWNQMIHNGNFTDASGWDFVGGSVSAADNVLTAELTSAVSGAGGTSITGNVLGTVQGHKYYCAVDVKYNNTLPNNILAIGSGGYDMGFFSWGAELNTWARVKAFFTRTTGGSDKIALYLRNGSWNVGDTASIKNFICVDLTLMFGEGNEPSTVEEFEAMFPASYYTYNAGTLLSAGVTEVDSKGKNLINEANVYSFTKMKYEGGVFTNTATDTKTTLALILQYANNGSYINTIVAQNTTAIGTTSVTFTATVSCNQLNVGHNGSTQDLKTTFYADIVAGKTYTLSINVISNIANQVGGIQFNDVMLEESATATNYVPYMTPIQYPIPAEVQALEGYGWSAGSVYNYIDYERKVFIKRVGRKVFDGTETWSTEYTYNFYSASGRGAGARIGKEKMVCSYCVCDTSITGDATDVSKFPSCYISTSGNLNMQRADITHTGADMQAWCLAQYNAGTPLTVYYELTTPVEIDISEYLTDDNLINVGAGGTLTFPNSNGTDYQIPVPSEETYMIDLQEAINNG